MRTLVLVGGDVVREALLHLTAERLGPVVLVDRRPDPPALTLPLDILEYGDAADWADFWASPPGIESNR